MNLVRLMSRLIRVVFARPPRFTFAGKVVIVTGASGGIGEAVARMAAAVGAKVALVARRADLLTALADELRAAGHEALCVPGDISSDADCARIAETVVAQWGRIDLLVNNAAVAHGGRLLDTDAATIRRVLDINLYGTLRLTQAVAPHLPPGGHIVNVSSVAADARAPGMGIYSASKAALNALSDILRRELAARRIYVTVFQPGWVRTPMIAGMSMDALRAVGFYNRFFLLEEPEAVARRLLRAVERRKSYVVMGGLGFRVGILTSRLSPRWLDNYYATFHEADRVIEAMEGVL